MPDNNNNRKIPTPPTRNIDFQVDTIRVDDPTWAAAYFSPHINTVTSNYRPGDKAGNEFNQSDNTLVHEQKHRDNAASGLYAYAVSPEQAYKLNMHDEITATMSELVFLRHKYIETGDISVFDGKGIFFDFYKEAVEKGTIKPGSPYQEDFEKDMALIVNGTRNKWEEWYSQQYNDNSMWDARHSSDKSGKYAEYYDENYQRGMKIAYTIGGVDFTKYMDRDAEIPEVGKFDLKCMDADKYSHQDLAKEFGIPVYDGSMSLEQYQKLVQHKLTMDKFMENSIFDTPQDYVDVLARQQKLYENPDWPYRDGLKKMLDEHTKDYNTAYKSINQNLVAAAVKSAALEYAKQGKELPPANDKAYNAAVDKIYTYQVDLNGDDIRYKGPVSLRKTLGDEKMLNTKLPPEAEKVQNMSGWERNFRKYMNFMGMPDNLQNNAVNNMEDKNAAVKGIGTVCVGAISPFIGAYSWCRKKLTSDDEKAEKVENKPINPVNKGAPKYRKWEDKDGSRVSEVQHRQLPDMRAEVIQKPKTSYALLAQAEKQKQQQNGIAAAAKEKAVPVGGNGDVDKAKMVRIIEYMNKINGSGKTVDAATTVDALCEKYGDKAPVLLMYAVNEPYKYAEYIGDKSIKTSRAALQHLCSLDGTQEEHVVKYAEAKSAGKEPPAALPQQNPQAAQEKPKQTANADNAHAAAESLKSGHNRVIAMRDKLRQGHVEQNDNTRVDSRSAAAERLRFEQAAQRHGNRQPITAEAMRKLIEERRINQ